MMQMLTNDSGDRCSGLGICCDFAEKVKEILWLVFLVKELDFVRKTFLVEYYFCSLCVWAAASHEVFR